MEIFGNWGDGDQMLNLPKHFAQRVAAFERDCARIVRRASSSGDVVALGDSLTEVNKGLPGWINRGIFADHLRWKECDVFDRVGSDRLHPNPKAIVILLGINDLNDNPSDVAGHATFYGYLLANLAQTYPHAKLVAVSLFPTNGPAAHLNQPILEFNEKLREMASSRGALYWDIHQHLIDTATGQGKTEALMVGDGIHVSPKGYKTINRFFVEHQHEIESNRSLGQTSVRLDVGQLGADILRAFGRQCWADRQGASTDAELISNHIKPEVDYLVQFIETGASVFRDLYLGSRAKFFEKNAHLRAEFSGMPRGLAQRDAQVWNTGLQEQRLSAELFERVTRAHADIVASIPESPPKRVRLLFVGDCLLEDVELLVGGQLLRQGILAEVDFIVSKNPVEQMREIRELDSQKYQGVVYSPLSWQFDQDFRNILELRPRSFRDLDADIRAMSSRIDRTLRLLAERFECNVYVHNTAAVIRASSPSRRIALSAATLYKRSYARKNLSAHIAEAIESVNAEFFKHVFLIDELAANQSIQDDISLGRFLYYSDAIHPTELSVVVSHQIGKFVAASARLLGKKVIVCDLDNTLWDGIIGEGLGVRHCKDRQRSLLELKKCGVVLAICSKNDPANVRWEGAAMSVDDFVAAEISWGPKAAAVARIQADLNLKAKDFVFIDDRTDERAMMTEAFPTITALDPCSESTWELFRTWSELLSKGPDADRTAMYRARAERQKVLDEQSNEQDAVEMFRRLQLRAEICKAKDSELTRIHELINRTNQWNLQGSRCTFQEVRAWHQSANHVIYSVRVKDKFGDMGLVCSCVGEYTESSLDVIVFVLSCRVFGYGIETLVLQKLEQDSLARLGRIAVRGFFRETPHNKPCREMYSKHGYAEVDGVWIHTGNPGAATQPTWFERIEVDA